MFDPTIYDNLKVMLEGQIYDLEFSNQLIIINRRDIVGLAAMSRSFSMQFQTQGTDFNYPYGEIEIHADLKAFSTELISGDEKTAGCRFYVRFYTTINDIDYDCSRIKEQFSRIWDGRPIIHQTVSIEFERNNKSVNEITLDFNRMINEDQLDDIPAIVDLSLESMTYLREHLLN